MAILLMIGAVTSWRSHNQLEAWIKTTRAAGDPVSLADLERKDVDPDQNAATYLALITDDAKKLYTEIHPYADPEGFNWRAGLDDAQVARVEAGFETYPNIFATLELAARCKQYAWPHDYTLPTDSFLAAYLELVNQSRNVARLHQYRARFLAASGKSNEAAMICLQQLRLCRLQDDEPLLVSFLVNTACRSIAIYDLNGILQTSELTEETHQAIEDELAQHDAMESFVHALKTDRAFGMETLRSMPGRMFARGQLTEYLKVMNEHVSMGAKSHYELTDSEPIQAKGAHAKNMQPALESSREAMNRIRTNIRCLRVLNAIHWKAKDADNVDIDAIGLPHQITVDPYNGKPLNVKSTNLGWIVYSVGKDRQDGGGQLKQLADVGVGPPELMD